jgi:DNA-binding NtrC family response regulator
VSDLNMPAMDGAALLKRLHAKMPRLPVILVSGAPPEELRRHTDAYGFVPKPIDIAALLRVVARARDVAEHQDGAAE